MNDGMMPRVIRQAETTMLSRMVVDDISADVPAPELFRTR